MPDWRAHRGPHPEDGRDFGPANALRLRAAVAEFSWLLSHEYAPDSALDLVGNRHQLTTRQRLAVRRASCSDAARSKRSEREQPVASLAGRDLVVDGFNLLTTIEAALGGGVLLACRDGAIRDMASVHGTWRVVAETEPALGIVADWTQRAGVARLRWLLDQPVSNSGRLTATIDAFARERGLRWEARAVPSPDRLLVTSVDPVATSDSVVIETCRQWVNAAAAIVAGLPGRPWVVDLQA